MAALGWLSCHATDIPRDDGWLGEAERRVLAGLRTERRRDDWLLGRWAAKSAVSGWLGVPRHQVEILAAPDGAPEAWVAGELSPLSISLSHRAQRAIVAVTDCPSTTGCDLEVIEPRSDAFVREWLSPSEQRWASGGDAAQQALLVNLAWAAKEAAAKLRREGLRLAVRQAIVSAEESEQSDGWRGVRIAWPDVDEPAVGWWRAERGWVVVVAARPPAPIPRPIVERA